MDISTTRPGFERMRGRTRWLGVLGIAAAGIVGCSQAGGSPSAPTAEAPSASASAHGNPEAPASPLGVAPRLLVLGGARAGSYGLWTYDPQTGWLKSESVSEATAVGRNETAVVLGMTSGIATRPLRDFAAAQTGDGAGWTPVPVVGRLVSVALSPSGRPAVVDVMGSTARYLVQGSSGAFTAISPGPRQPLSPVVGWLGDSRIVALSVDDFLVSHMCVIDAAAGRCDLLDGLTGVRVFAVSPTGSTIAAVTEEAVYVGPAASWLANEPVEIAVAVPEETVVWDLALDSTGARMALFMGKLSPDGTITDGRAVAFESTPSGWKKMFEAELPFPFAGGQIWLS